MAARATIAPAEPANGSAQNAPTRTRSETIMRPRRESRSSRGPRSRPIATAGRNSAIITALTHGPESVRSLTSTISATVASRVPRLEPRVARNSRRKLRAVPIRLSWRRKPVTPGRSVSGSRCGRPHSRECGTEEVVLVGRAHGDADRLLRTEARERPNDDTLTKQLVEDGLRILAEINVEKVPDRGADDGVTRVAQDSLELRPVLGVAPPPALELLSRVETGERSFLGGSGQIERATRLAKSGHELRRRHAVADAQSREAVDLRERSQHDHTAAALEVLLDRIGI